MAIAPFIIGLAGPAGVGKNTIADALGFPQAAFAARLKDDLQPLLSQIGLDLNKREDKEKARELLVAYGRLGRKIHPDYWLNRIYLPYADVVTITDVRYLNEAKWIHNAGGVVVMLSRRGIASANTEELNSLSDIRNSNLPIVHISNDRTPREAASAVLQAVAARRKLHQFENRKEPIKAGFYVWSTGKFALGIQYARVRVNPDGIHADAVFPDRTELDYWTPRGKLGERIVQWIDEGSWVYVADLDQCGTLDGFHPLPSVMEQSPPLNTEIQDEADRIHAQERQRQFTSIAEREDQQEKCGILQRFAHWWINN